MNQDDAAKSATHFSSTIPIPLGLDEVTPEWVSQALASRYPGVEVTRFELDGPFGYKPNKARLRLEYNESGRAARLPAQMIVKGGFPKNNNSGAGLDLGMQLEILAHRDVAPLLGINTPKSFYIGYQNGQGVLLLEDLTLKSVQFFNVFSPLRYDQAATFIDAQAAFHAKSWNSEEIKSGSKLGPNSDVARVKALLNQHYLDRLMVDSEYFETHIQLPRGALLPKSLRDAHRMKEALEKLRMLTFAQPQCYVHGDEHLGNLYIEADGTPGFIDYAGRVEGWNIGFTFFLIQTLDALDRRHWERPLLERYIHQLRQNGIRGLALEDAWFVYQCTVLQVLSIWINNSPRWQPEAINTANAAKAALAVIDHRSFELLGC